MPEALRNEDCVVDYINYERKYKYAKNRRVHAIIGTQARQNISQKLQARPDLLSFEKFYKHNRMTQRVHDNEVLIREIGKQDISYLFTETIVLNAYMPCYFTEGNSAWISRDNKGHYRYFSQDSRTFYTLDILDFIELYFRVNSREAIFIASQKLDIKIEENEYFRIQQDTYSKNLSIIYEFDKKHKLMYPNVWKYIEAHRDVLEALNVIGSANLKDISHNYLGDNVFFSSRKYIAKYLNLESSSKICPVINLLCVLGLIIKVPIDKVPYVLLQNSNHIAKNRALPNVVSYYTMPPMQQVLGIAEVRAKEMRENNISYSNISEKRLAGLFDQETLSRVFVQKSKEVKKETEALSLPVMMTQAIESLVEAYGYCTKAMVITQIEKDFKQENIAKEVDKIWKSVVSSYSYKKPTKEMKMRYGLTDSQYILTKKEEN